MYVVLLTTIIVLILPDLTFGWGLATHVELSRAVLAQLPAVGTALAAMILAHSRDFIYGNIIADTILAKGISRRRRRCHDWSAGWRLLENAYDNHSRQVLAYGMLTHLAADTVAHNAYLPRIIESTGSSVTFGHLYWEIRADQLVAGDHRRTARRLLKQKHPGHERLLAEHLYPPVRWFALNRCVFERVNMVANGRKFAKTVEICRDLSQWRVEPQTIERYKLDACQRMLSVIRDGLSTAVVSEDPNGYATLQGLKQRRAILTSSTDEFDRA